MEYDLEDMVYSIKEEEIYKILMNTINFSTRFKILFYTKQDVEIYGYLKISGKILKFEIQFYHSFNNDTIFVNITIGKIKITRKLEEVM